MKKSAKPQVKTYDLAFFYAFISWKIRREGKTFAK